MVVCLFGVLHVMMFFGVEGAGGWGDMIGRGRMGCVVCEVAGGVREGLWGRHGVHLWYCV